MRCRFAALILFAAALTGCGRDAPPPDAGGTATATPGETAEPPATATPGDAAEATATPGDAAEPPATATPGETAELPATATPGDAAEPPATDAMTRVNVYFARTIETAPGGAPERIAASARTVAEATAVRGALDALFTGPNGLETEIGMFTAIPPDAALHEVTVVDGVATVDVSAAFELSGGSLTDTLKTAQIVFTLTQFPEVDVVAFRIDGQLRDTISGHGIDVDRVDRSDFDAIRPAILVEQPAPGEPATDPLRVAGEANTFEAVFQLVVVDPAGRILHDDFVMATAGSGTFGTFEVDVPAGSDRTGLGSVVVFELSAKDGSQTNLVEIPVRFGE